ncbi:hypothetical protein PHYBOEH_003122 [Phytophthora boehmeriae]|uniref:Mucin-like protein n=1 Tax=Phytophthora boehmeriae TaxID=109152 RepID=A0A8T1WVI1_9STRA|nr:hypothetical protein PHYBOEH_003122 [Phytophthora boehmeriae]
MVSTTSLATFAAAAAVSVQYVQAHGYMENPLSEFKDKKTSEWIVQIDPQWKGDWENADGDEGLVALYKELKASNNAKDIRTLLDSDTTLYGENCGYTNPDVTPKDPPTDGTATFSRGIVHAGPCEIWLDDEMVLQNDDCQSAYGDGTQETISVFKPVDYSSCASGGCMFRFYWLALQRLDGKTYWQVYKNCIPLSGPAGGGASQTTPSTGDGSNTSQTSPSTGDSPSSGESDSPSTQSTPAPQSGGSEESSSPSSPSTPSTPSADTPEITPAPSTKCNGRRKRV